MGPPVGPGLDHASRRQSWARAPSCAGPCPSRTGSRRAGTRRRWRGKLEEANVSLRPGEWAVVHGLIAVLAGLLTTLLTNFNVLLAIIAFVLGLLLPWLYLGHRASKRRKEFYAALPDAMQMLAGSLSAGYSLPQALDNVAKESGGAFGQEINRALLESRLGLPHRGGPRGRRPADGEQGLPLGGHGDPDQPPGRRQPGRGPDQRGQDPAGARAPSPPGQDPVRRGGALRVDPRVCCRSSSRSSWSLRNPGYLEPLYTTLIGWVMHRSRCCPLHHRHHLDAQPRQDGGLDHGHLGASARACRALPRHRRRHRRSPAPSAGSGPRSRPPWPPSRRSADRCPTTCGAPTTSHSTLASRSPLRRGSPDVARTSSGANWSQEHRPSAWTWPATPRVGPRADPGDEDARGARPRQRRRRRCSSSPGRGSRPSSGARPSASSGSSCPTCCSSTRRSTGRNRSSKALPDSIDLLTISVESGLAFDAALAQVARNTDGPLAEEFTRVLKEIQIGSGRSDALRALSERTDVEDLQDLPQLHGPGREARHPDRRRPARPGLRDAPQALPADRGAGHEAARQDRVPADLLASCPHMFIVILGPAVISIYENILNR